MSKWTPDHCRVGGADCVPIFHVNPEFTAEWVEQLINNLHLNATVYYAMWDLYRTLADTWERDQHTMFYSWSPHEFLASGKYTRVTFPQYTQRCKDKDTYDCFGGMDCDQDAQDVSKFMSVELPSRSLAAAKFVEQYEIGVVDQEFMLGNLCAPPSLQPLSVSNPASRPAFAKD
jgi:hypothetical protein